MGVCAWNNGWTDGPTNQPNCHSLDVCNGGTELNWSEHQFKLARNSVHISCVPSDIHSLWNAIVRISCLTSEWCVVTDGTTPHPQLSSTDKFLIQNIKIYCTIKLTIQDKRERESQRVHKNYHDDNKIIIIILPHTTMQEGLPCCVGHIIMYILTLKESQSVFSRAHPLWPKKRILLLFTLWD